MRYSILLLLISVLHFTYGQEMSIGQSTITIEKSDSKYQLKLDGKVLLDKIDSIAEYKGNNHFYIVKKNGKYGIYTLLGYERIPVKFEKISRFFNEFWLVYSNRKFGIYNLYTGKSLPTEYDTIRFSGKVGAEFIVKKEGKYGVLNYEWKVVVPIHFDLISLVGGELELVSGGEKSYFMGGQIVRHKIRTDKAVYLADFQIGYVFEKENKCGVITSKGEILLPPKYEDIIPKRRLAHKSTTETILFVKSNSKWGIVDAKDNIIAPVEYESVEIGSDDHALVTINTLKQFYDLTNKQIVEGITFERYYYLDKYSRIERNGLKTLIDNATMKLVFPFKYSFVIDDRSGFFSVGINNKYGLVDSNDKLIIPLVYDSPLIVSCGDKIVVRRGDQYGIIDTSNKVLIPLSTQMIIAYSDSFERTKEHSFQAETLDCNLRIKKN